VSTTNEQMVCGDHEERMARRVLLFVDVMLPSQEAGQA